ncbi:MAG: phosphoribosyltransferase family protein [Flavobacteriales bacterium]|jgi:pyrimidine operon attenuation protein / uracil phosphoribosyltransferase
MPKERTLILESKQIGQKLTRIAHEIHENNYLEKEIILVGVVGRGLEVAERLFKLLQGIAESTVTLYQIEINKDKPLSAEVKFNGEVKSLKGKSVILIDDVLNSGRTLIYASKYLLDAEPRSLATATLVDRFHRRFPIRADYVGLTLSTNLKEHVSVEMEKGNEKVYLE